MDIAKIEAAVRNVVSAAGFLKSERDLQERLCREFGGLGICERELGITFKAPIHLPPCPPPEIGPSRDVCATKGMKKLDLLVREEQTWSAIELKFGSIPKWKGSWKGLPVQSESTSDTTTYGFLKDIHRMERLDKVSRKSFDSVKPQKRFCALLTNDPTIYNGKIVHERLKLIDRTLSPKHLVQYNLQTAGKSLTSPNTLWVSYPPFYLAGSYPLKWIDLKNDVSAFLPTPPETRAFPSYRLMVVEVLPVEMAPV